MYDRKKRLEWVVPPLPQVGSVVDGRFVVVDEPHEGGFGAVFKVSSKDDPSLPQAMALKCMKNPPLSDTEEDRFKQEVEFLREINQKCRKDDKNFLFPRFFGNGVLKGGRFV